MNISTIKQDSFDYSGSSILSALVFLLTKWYCLRLYDNHKPIIQTCLQVKGAFDNLLIVGDSKALKDQLGNKHLRELLVAIDSSPNPGEKLDEAMQIPIFTEFMDVCMKVIEGKEEMS